MASSVGKGSSWLVIGRVSGMGASFLLFMLLSWRSTDTLGIFRTAMTFLLILDNIPLLGMHRWLASEIGRRLSESSAIFMMGCRVAIAVGVIASFVLLGIAAAGTYGETGSRCIVAVALVGIPSAVNLCVMSALIGLGHSQQSAIITLIETLARVSVSIMLVLAKADLVWIFIVYGVTRWLCAGWGFLAVRRLVAGSSPVVGSSLRREFYGQMPNLAMAMAGFLTIRMAAMLILPIVRNGAEAGLYAAPFQLFDLLMLLPTIMTISTNFAFVESAALSESALMRVTNQLIALSAMFAMPVAALGLVLAEPGIEGLFGTAFLGSVTPFRLLLAGLLLMVLDQILSLNMAVSQDYRTDRICVTSGGAVTALGTWVLGTVWGASGAALALVLGCATTVLMRVILRPQLMRIRLFSDAIRRETIAAIGAAAAVAAVLPFLRLHGPMALLAAVLLALAGGLIYLALLHRLGGLGGRRIQRIRMLMARRG